MWLRVDFVDFCLLCLLRPFQLQVLQDPAWRYTEMLWWEFYFLGKSSRIPFPEVKMLHDSHCLEKRGGSKGWDLIRTQLYLLNLSWNYAVITHCGHFFPSWWFVLPPIPSFWVTLGGGWRMPRFDPLLSAASCLLQPWRPSKFLTAVFSASCSVWGEGPASTLISSLLAESQSSTRNCMMTLDTWW